MKQGIYLQRNRNLLFLSEIKIVEMTKTSIIERLGSSYLWHIFYYHVCQQNHIYTSVHTLPFIPTQDCNNIYI